MRTIQIPSVIEEQAEGREAAIVEALKRIPPLWPLAQFVAVNPFLGFSDRPFAQASAILRRTSGYAPVQTAAEYRQAWRAGEITAADLAAVTDRVWTEGQLLKAVECEPESERVASFADRLDQSQAHAHWARFISEEVAKWCGVHFDRNQATWVSPWKQLGFFAAWKSAAVHDRKPEIFGLKGFRQFVKSLPAEASAAAGVCLDLLAPPAEDLADFLHRQLLGNAGWAGYVQYLVREARMCGQAHDALRDLLAVRLAYDAALHQCFAGSARSVQLGRSCRAAAPVDEAFARWQRAYEAGYQRTLAAQLAAQPALPATTRPPVQAVFCIDVRSELVRRHLEAELPGSRTLGFAGFFGFPVAHQPAATIVAAARCPALLVPPIRSRETGGGNAPRSYAEKSAWKAFQNSAASCFTFVEVAGFGFAAKLVSLRGGSHGGLAAKPEMLDISLERRASLAEAALRGMSLTQQFARIVLFCGHGSHSANNPHAASVDCGACGGHAGDVNARLAVAALNDPEVRGILVRNGIEIPADTLFVAAKHDTLSDDFCLYDPEEVPSTHRAEMRALQEALSRVSVATRRERAARLGLPSGLSDRSLAKLIEARGTHIAELRPEWALANNAAMVVAPRSRTANLKLEGRVFLHEYEPATDVHGVILAAILAAPVVVASWINLQYYGSRVCPQTLAAGDKKIHQVVAGIGVIEGNAGDLRPGLPLQSIHNGKEFVHEPRRLTVFIDDRPERIDAALASHPGVRELFVHEWIHLVALQGNTASQFRNGAWQEII